MAMAQVTGTVESIGFDSYFRPDTWTSMVITVQPTSSTTDFYEIQVHLQDLDRDQPIFERTISVTGAAEGRNQIQRFRMNFIAPPTNGGLPTATDPAALRELQERLKVSIHRATGKKEWICDLPITGTLNNIDPIRTGFDDLRGAKLMVAVNDGRSRTTYTDDAGALQGVMEDVKVVNVHSLDLPDSVLGYDAVDAIIWSDADPQSLKSAGDERFRALLAYVNRGGRLVICQPFDWQKILGFEDLLPVVVQGIEEKNDLSPLKELMMPSSASRASVVDSAGIDATKPPFRFARAKAKPNAIVAEWIHWNDPKDVSPYIVRMPYGLGSVTWVAQDLGDPTMPRTRTGWVYVWDRVFDWHNSPIFLPNKPADAVRFPYQPGPPMDIGRSLLERWMDLHSKSAWLITLALAFFCGYWVLAGPVTYTWLAAKKKTHLSWMLFAVVALGATGLTALIVKLVLRGPPELKHFSVVRSAPGEPEVVISRMGLYIPRDGSQTIELEQALPGAVDTITALPIHPAYLHDPTDLIGAVYDVPVPDAASTHATSVSYPYRSTLKKFRASWTGEMGPLVQGSAKLVSPEDGFLQGHLTNGLKTKLKNIYIAFSDPDAGAFSGDWVLYMPEWDAGVTLDLSKEFNKQADGKQLSMGIVDSMPFNGQLKMRGRLEQDWSPRWYGSFASTILENTFDDSAAAMRQTLPMFSFFDRLAPMKNSAVVNSKPTRFELLRRGGRELEMSQALAAGEMVVLAECEGALPLPLTVQGTHVEGDGLIFYQFAIPMDRSAAASTTQPAQ